MEDLEINTSDILRSWLRNWSSQKHKWRQVYFSFSRWRNKFVEPAKEEADIQAPSLALKLDRSIGLHKTKQHFRKWLLWRDDKGMVYRDRVEKFWEIAWSKGKRNSNRFENKRKIDCSCIKWRAQIGKMDNNSSSKSDISF